MAGKFFNQRVKGANNNFKAYLIVGAIIFAIFFIVILFVAFSNKETSKPEENVVVKIRDVVTIEINSDYPDKILFFSELQNVKESDINIYYDDVNLSKVGEYAVSIDLYDETYTSKLAVVDTKSPELIVKNISIDEGDSYSADDFVESCQDNSNEDCIVEFYSEGKSQDGSSIDYSSYKNEGTYTIQIIAKDSSGNVTTPLSATLTIGSPSGDNEKPTYCSFGNNDYDQEKYILGVDVTENSCALDLNLYYDETISAPAYNLAKADIEKLKKEIDKLNTDESVERNVKQSIKPIINTDGKGIVGYTVHIELSFDYDNDSSEVVASYYIKSDGSRIYSINKYNLS